MPTPAYNAAHSLPSVIAESATRNMRERGRPAPGLRARASFAPGPARVRQRKRRLAEPFCSPLALTTMDIEVTFPGGKQVEARFGAHVVKTDQAVAHGGGGTAPEPFEVFLASLATCAGIYVLGFCQAREISTAGVQLVQHHHFDEASHRLERVELEIVLPADFPEKYRSSVARAAEGCKVKKTLTSPPEVTVVVGVRAA